MSNKNELKQEDLSKVNGGLVNRYGFIIYQNFDLLLLKEKDEVTLFKFEENVNRFVSKGNVVLDKIINNNNVIDVEFTYNNESFHINVAASAVDYHWAIGPKDQVNPTC